MADIVLVYPKTGLDIKDATIDLPLSSLSVAAMVAGERTVKIIDQRVDSDWKVHLRKELAKNPVMVGTTSMTGSQINFALEASKIVKENSNAPMVWGGVHPTLLPEQTLKHPLVDVVMAGEGELAIKKLVNALEKGKGLERINNIYFEKEGKVAGKKVEEYFDMDKLPTLPYGLIDEKHYISTKSMVKEGAARTLPFITSRGCPHGCAFCCNPRLSKRRWRCMSAKKAYKDVMYMVERFDLDSVIFHDENFLTNPKRIEELASMINNKFSWSAQARMDELERTDIGLLERNGLNLLQPGIESGSDRILSLVNKGETKKQILQANKKLAKTNITSVYNFMMGFPTETIGEVEETVDLALKLIKDNPNGQISGFYVFAPYPGTQLFDLAVKEGFEAPTGLEGWARFSRQHLATPWIQDKLPTLLNIMYTSKFVDGVRLKNFFREMHLPDSAMKWAGNYYRKKWEKHEFRDSLDIKVLNLAAKVRFGWKS